MAMDQKRMGIYSTAPSKYQTTEQFKNLDGALVSPAYRKVLVPGREDGLTDFARAAKRRKILALADDVLHGRTLFISSTTREPHAFKALVERRLKERDKKWPDRRKDALAWEDVNDTWDDLRDARSHRHRQKRSETLGRSPPTHRSVGQKRLPATGQETGTSNARVIDETVLVRQMDDTRSETIGCEYKLAMGAGYARQPHKSKSTQAARSSRSEPREQKRRADKSRVQQNTLTKTYQGSRVSSQTSTNAKDEELVKDYPPHAVHGLQVSSQTTATAKDDEAMEYHPLLALHDRIIPEIYKRPEKAQMLEVQSEAIEDHPLPALHDRIIPEIYKRPAKAQTVKVQSRAAESSPFVFHKRKSRSSRPSEPSTVQDKAASGGTADTTTAKDASSGTKARASLITKHLNTMLPVSPASGKTSSSVTKALRRAFRNSGADISSIDDVPQAPPITHDVVLSSEHGPEECDAPGRESPAWPGTQALLAKANEELFHESVDQSILPPQPDGLALASNSVQLAFDNSSSHARVIAAPETQDILDAWSPWSASKTQRRRAFNRASMGSMASPTVDPKDTLKTHGRMTSTGGTKDARSSLRFSMDFDHSVSQIDDVPRSRWTAVNQTDVIYENELSEEREKATSRNLSFAQAAQTDSIDAARAEHDMDQCITDIALEFLGSSTQTV